jgi:hypothetical protein
MRRGQLGGRYNLLTKTKQLTALRQNHVLTLRQIPAAGGKIPGLSSSKARLLGIEKMSCTPSLTW